MANSTPNDPWAKPALVGGLVLIGATVFVLVSNLFHTISKNSLKGTIDVAAQVAAKEAAQDAAVAANIAPIGTVNTGDPNAPKVARTGEALFNAVCTSCHTAGVLGSPKFGDKAAWEPRAAQGLDTLVKHATDGIRAMPAHGGDPTTTTEELSNAIVYMTGKAGIDLSSQVKKAAAPAADAKPATDAKAAATAPASAAKPAADAKPAAAEPAAKAAAAAPAGAIDGEKVYKGTCFACHDVGAGGSPKLGDKADWAPRIAKGADALHSSAINGRMNVTPGKVMPPKGGNTSLSDAEVKAAVDFMMSKGK